MSAMIARTSVLIIDNSPQARQNYRSLLSTQNEDLYAVVEADSAETALQLCWSNQPDCILLDGAPGTVELLRQMVADQQAPSRAVVMLMAQHDMAAVEFGAQDYLAKERITAEALHRTIQRAIEKASLLRKIEEQRRELERLTNGNVTIHKPHAPGQVGMRPCGPAPQERGGRGDSSGRSARVQSLGKTEEIFYGSSEGMTHLMEQVERVAPLDATILLTGETGTGKTCLAKQIHKISPRRQEPFMVVNCGALSVNVIESELFGHVRGSFTGAYQDRIGKFAAVGRGTLFLDEIDALPIELQAKLLRVVDERCFEPVGSNRLLPMEARLVAASNRILEEEVTAGRFRADLHYRINVLEFNLLPLRERRDLIPFLADHFFQECITRQGSGVCGIADEAMAALQRYNWPGNIRQLRNVIERAVAVCPGQEIQLEDLPDSLRQTQAQAADCCLVPALCAPSEEAPAATMSEACEEAEINRIRQALLRHNNNRQRAASELGVSRMTLYKRLHRYGLFLPREKSAPTAPATAHST